MASKPWSEQETETLRELLNDCGNISQIARKMKRSNTAVHREARRLGLHNGREDNWQAGARIASQRLLEAIQRASA